MLSTIDKYIVGLILIIFCLAFSFCSVRETLETDKLSRARDLLYHNQLDETESIMVDIDTISLNEYEMKIFHLTNGFFQYKLGNKNGALKNLKQASLFKDQYLNAEEKAELHLILGLVFENALLNAEAARSFLSALNQFGRNQNSEKYFLALLGVARTSKDGKSYLKKADELLKRNASNRNMLLYLNTKANLTDDIQERNFLVLKSLSYFDEEYDVVKQISLFSSIALNYQILENSDSAFFYANRLQNLIDENDIAPEKLLHTYLIKAYIEVENGRFESGEASIEFIFDHGIDYPGILSQASLIRSHIYKHNEEFKLAFKDLNERNNLLEQEFEKTQEYQLGLLSIQYQLQQKELELTKIKNAWLITGIIFMLGLIIIWALFYYYRKRAKQIKRELEKKYKLASNRLTEQLELNISSTQAEQKNEINKKHDVKKDIVPGLEKQEFNMLFNIEHPLFRVKLNKVQPGLTQSDLKYCDCLLAELTVYQTTKVLGVSVSAVKKARKKLRKIFSCDTIKELVKVLKTIEETPYDSA